MMFLSGVEEEHSILGGEKHENNQMEFLGNVGIGSYWCRLGDIVRSKRK